MIFLIEYDRPSGSIVTFRVFGDADRSEADNARLEIELNLNRKGIDREVVLLEAASEEALHRTHRRYFENPSQILKSASTTDKGNNIFDSHTLRRRHNALRGWGWSGRRG